MASDNQTGGLSFQPVSMDDLLGIDSYGDGGFRLRGRRFEGSVVVTPSGVYPLKAKSREDITPATLETLAAQQSDIEIILFGVGEQLLPLKRETREWLVKNGWSYDLMDTGAAARTFNLLLIEGRRVAAVLLAVD